jgi:DNA primase
MADEVSALAEKYLGRLKHAGNSNVMAICPFHRKADGSLERHPSFAMNTRTGLWICHSCKEHGNLSQFLRLMNVSYTVVERYYRPLLDTLAKARPQPPDPLKPKVLTNRPLEEDLLGLFDKCPTALLKEGFEESTLRAFDIGFDDLHMRITFPLRDLNGVLVGVSGRAVLDEDLPRYKIYDTEYESWGLPRRNTDKAPLIWGVHNIYPHAIHNNIEFMVLVEGFKACMWLAQAGIKDTCALIGSYLSNEQKWLLEHMGVPLILMLDNDEAGVKGRDYAAQILAKSLSVRIAEYEGNQPSDVPPEQVRQAISQAKDYYLWDIERGM